MLFTGEEKREIWRRLKSGQKVNHYYTLVHEMKPAEGNKESAEQLDFKINQMRAHYRLAERGLIKNRRIFNRVAKELIG